ncbi:MAG: carbon-nitrogen hydrolase family protein, partial [Gammaproteobacteria bacterium]
YPVERHEDWYSYERKLDRWVSEAAHHGARLLVFPEYGPMELASLFGEEVCRSLPVQLDAMQGLLSRFLHLHQLLAARYAVHIVAGSFPVAQDGGGYRNRSHLVRPDGQIDWQEKLQMTRFENEDWLITPGNTLKVFDTPIGALGVTICYDVEFPLIARALADAGARILLTPSCTDTLAGWYRVRIGCRARALENQLYVIQAPTVGNASWSEAIDINVGAAGVFGPPDRGFPHDGVLARGTQGKPGWVYADLDPALIDEVRSTGQVLNHRDWAGQARLPEVERQTVRID